MLSKQHSSKVLLADMKKTLIFSKPIVILFFLLNFVFSIILIIVVSVSTPNMSTASLNNSMSYDVTHLMQWIGLTFIFFCIFSFSMVLWTFRFLYNDRRLDLYHALPIPRSYYILSRFFSISFCMIITVLSQMFLLLVAKLILAQQNITFDFFSIAMQLITILAASMALTGVMIFCAVNATRFTEHIIYVLGLSVILPIGLIFVLRFPQQHVAGFYVDDTVIGYLFPLANIGLIITGQGHKLVQTISMLVICALLLRLSIKAYNTSGGKASNTKPLARIIQFATQVFSLSFLSLLMHWLLLEGITTLKPLRFKPLLSVVISIPLAFIITMLLEALVTSKRNYKKNFIQFGMVVVIFILFSSGMQMFATRYETNIPVVEDIESVFFTDNRNLKGNSNANILAFEEMFGLQQRNSTITALEGKIHLTDSHSYEQLLSLHKDSISFFNDTDTRDSDLSYTVTYILKNGKKITRELVYSDTLFSHRFTISSLTGFDYETENQLTNSFQSFSLSKEVLEKGSPLFFKSTEDLLGIQISTIDSMSVTDPTFMKLFVDTLKRDLLSNKTALNTTTTPRQNTIQFYYKKNPLATRQPSLDDLDFLSKKNAQTMNALFDYYIFEVPDTFDDTLALLTDHHYTNRLVELHDIKLSNSMMLRFIPVSLAGYGKFSLGDDHNTNKNKISNVLGNSNHIDYLWKYGTDDSPSNIETVFSTLNPDEDQMQLFLDSRNGYLVFFMIPTSNSTFSYTRLHFIDEKEAPQEWSVLYDKSKNKNY